jgi:hypothetical protein
MGFARAACTQESMIGNGKVGKNRDMERIVYGAGDRKMGDCIGTHDYLW